MGRQRLVLIDATAFCYRAFYALKGLSTSFGQPTNAIYGFINMLNKVVKEEKPDFLAVCFDVSRDTFRQKKFADYKIQRPPMPDGLKSQIPLIKEIVSAYGIAVLEKEGYEADDIIATAVARAKEKDWFTEIVSSDKDILQLVNADTVVRSPHKDGDVLYDDNKVKERFGISPSQIIDLITLSGDSVDNIPGIPGIGEKTAVELIGEFGGLNNLLKNIEKIKSEKIRKALGDNNEMIKLNRELAVLDKNVDMDLDLDKLKIEQPDAKELFRLFKHLEFKKWLKDLPVEEEETEGLSIVKLKDADLKDLKLEGGELILCGDGADNLVFFAQDTLFRVDNPGVGLKALLSSRQVKKTGHDLKKIKVCLEGGGVSLGGLYFDTMVAAHLINPAKSEYGLVDVAWDYLGRISGSQGVDNKNAVNLIRQLRPKLEKELSDKSLLSLFTDIEMPLAGVLARMELNGIKLDLALLSRLSRDIEKRLAGLIEDIFAISGCQFNINSPKQLRDVLFERLKLPVVKKNKTGPSTDEEVLKNLASRHKLPALLLEYRQLTKLKNTYVDALPELVNPKTGRVHTQFNQTVTETGRLSSTHPNLQNIPVKTDIGRNIRKAIIAASPDGCLLSCDYSQIELRILAHLSRDENLISAFKENKDIHKATASLIYGLPQDDISDSQREVAKRVNFGIVYGLSAWGLSRDLGLPINEAQGFIDAYFLRYPKVKEYIQEQIDKAEKSGFVTTILGRRRYLPEIKNKNQGIRQFAQRQAVNTPIQGSASDLIKLAMIQIDNQLKTRNLPAMMILQIHDELVFETAEAHIDEVAALAKDKMENVLKLAVPVIVVIKKGKNWLDMEEYG
jgi:DNA polymerase-1